MDRRQDVRHSCFGTDGGDVGAGGMAATALMPGLVYDDGVRLGAAAVHTEIAACARRRRSLSIRHSPASSAALNTLPCAASRARAAGGESRARPTRVAVFTPPSQP